MRLTKLSYDFLVSLMTLFKPTGFRAKNSLRYFFTRKNSPVSPSELRMCLGRSKRSDLRRINLVLRCYANRFNLSAMIALNASFISFGKKERSINANHLSLTFANLVKMLLITFSSNPDACIEVTKSAFLILRFLPLRVSANS